jgi:hypothetical protein
MQKVQLLLLALIFTSFFVACSEDTSPVAPETLSTLDTLTVPDTTDINATDELTDAEIHGLIFMREEEKLARDVYIYFYAKYQMSIFDNISNAEVKHMSQLKTLIDKYGLVDPVVNDSLGVFENEDLANLYLQLITAGDVSLLEALKIGATIEDLDIRDLIEYESEVTNTDIIDAYEQLTKGSRNHLRSFYPKILENGGTYEAQFISQELFDEIVNSPKETGG